MNIAISEGWFNYIALGKEGVWYSDFEEVAGFMSTHNALK